MAMCEWCRTAEAVTEVELEPAKHRIDTKTRKRVVAKFPKKISVCRECSTRVEAQMETARREKEKSKQPEQPF